MLAEKLKSRCFGDDVLIEKSESRFSADSVFSS